MRTRIRERTETPLTLAEVEREHIHDVLIAAQWNKVRAAQLLGIDRRTLYRKITAFGITSESTCAAASEA